MRVLITGAQGQVGHELQRLAPLGFVVTALGSSDLDIADAEQVRRVFAEVEPQLVINAAAYTAVDKAETETAQAWAVNRDGVLHLAEAAANLAVPVLHISTDYVFAGDAFVPYCETDPTAPAGVYGASKLAGEIALAQHCPQHIVLRTSWVFGLQGSNFVKTMLRLGRERAELGVVADQQGCPTSAASIARALWRLAVQYRSTGTLQWGTYHFSGIPACSWFEFAQAIFQQAVTLEMLPRPPKLNAIATADFPTAARRPSWSVLDCTRLQSAHGIMPTNWRDELQVVLHELRSTA